MHAMQKPDKVTLFVTCLIDQFFPQVGMATVQILKRLGMTVEFPRQQTCCGQPFFNTGYRSLTLPLVKHFVKTFQSSRYIICPSGSCTAMVKTFYRDVCALEPSLYAQVAPIVSRVYELSDFLVNVLQVEDLGASLHTRVSYQDSCHLLRELHLKDEPRRLLKHVHGLDLIEMRDADVCCGFGGTFAVKFNNISEAMLEDKLANIHAADVDAVVATDVSCLMHINGALARRHPGVRALHLAEVLASRETTRA